MSKFSKKNKNWKTLYVDGLCSYAKVYEPDEYRGVEFWKINIYPDEESLKKIKNSGLQLKRHDDDGSKSGVSGEYYTFRRPLSKQMGDSEIFFTPPQILDADGESIMKYTLDGEICFQFDDEDANVQREGKQVLIGNGSKVNVQIFMYQSERFGWGHRLNSVKILDLIEYNPDDKKGNTEDEDQEEVEKEVSVETEAPKGKSSKVKW